MTQHEHTRVKTRPAPGNEPTRLLRRELFDRFLLPCGRHYAERPKWRSPYDMRIGIKCEQCGRGKEGR